MGEQPSRAPRFGVIVPCRNEADVIERRIRNLARLDWPESERPHRVIVVDDGSEDGTAEVAHRVLAELEPTTRVHFEVAVNPGPHGKARAMSLALDALGDIELVLLTDADVVFRPPTPMALAAAFAADGRLGMASGAQEFVRDLAEDGTCLGAEGGEPDPAPDRYDRLTAIVRRLESRVGRLFSVHGQCLCWCADLGLRPTAGFAADDLDLMLQVRAQGKRVELITGARFLEPKIRGTTDREFQAVRRAQAYFQLVRRTATPLRGGPLDRAQWLAYRFLPAAAPIMPLAGWYLVHRLLELTFGPDGDAGDGLAMALLGLNLAIWLGLFLAASRTLFWISRASARERRHALTDSWETARA